MFYPSVRGLARLLCAGLAWVGLSTSLNAQVFTVRILESTSPPGGVTNTLVAHGDLWHWHRGTNDPQADWIYAETGDLDATWVEAPGGFGYGDVDIVGEATTLTGMNGVFSTVYIRRIFTVPAGLDPAAQVMLNVDFDDGFVAYLRGVEVTRFNAPGNVGDPIPSGALATDAHEATCCTAPLSPVLSVGLGSVATTELTPGDHILALVGLNRATVNGDFHLIPDLFTVTGGSTEQPVVQTFPGYAVSTTNLITLAGSNTLAGSARVSVNGVTASFDSGAGTWSHMQTLKPGWNEFLIVSEDAGGDALGALTQEVIYQTQRIFAGGTLGADLRATAPGTVVHVTNVLVIPAGRTLELGGGAVLLADRNRTVTATAGGRIDIHGSETNRVYLRPSGGTNGAWGPLSATGSGAFLEVRFADVGRAQINSQNGATGVIEDSTVHDFDDVNGGTFGRPLMLSSFSARFNVRRCHFYNYYETLVRDGLIQVEECLFEYMVGDALDFDGAAFGSYCKRNTFRHGNRSNADAVDIGPGQTGGCTNTVIEGCLMWDFPFDKGVSIGDTGSSQAILVTNCLIYGCESGIAVKDRCSAIIANCTLVSNEFGINLRAKFPETPPGIGGYATNTFNNILWGNRTFQIWVTNEPVIVVHYTDVEGTNWPGDANISSDPLWVNPDIPDYRLGAGSACHSAGRDGGDLGARFPVGASMAPSHHRIQQLARTPTGVEAVFWLDSGRSCTVEFSQTMVPGSWQSLARFVPGARPRLLRVPDAGSGPKFYRLLVQ